MDCTFSRLLRTSALRLFLCSASSDSVAARCAVAAAFTVVAAPTLISFVRECCSDIDIFMASLCVSLLRTSALNASVFACAVAVRWYCARSSTTFMMGSI